jgi:hypothetical protein
MKSANLLMVCFLCAALELGGCKPGGGETPLADSDSLTLDGTTWTVGELGQNKTVPLRVNTLKITNGGRIITNGNNLTITAQHVISQNGAIMSFPDARLTPADSPDGSPGVNGLGGGTVEIQADGIDGQLDVSLPGQNGGRGGRGPGGAPGAPGRRGADAADGLLNCARGGENGTPGGIGGQGGTGMPGGSGGDGGVLVLKGNLARKQQNINFSAPAGKAGPGGPGGMGGPGGSGGQGGSGSVHCGGGAAGVSGPAGTEGAPGAQGNVGHPGRREPS